MSGANGVFRSIRTSEFFIIVRESWLHNRRDKDEVCSEVLKQLETILDQDDQRRDAFMILWLRYRAVIVWMFKIKVISNPVIIVYSLIQYTILNTFFIRKRIRAANESVERIPKAVKEVSSEPNVEPFSRWITCTTDLRKLFALSR